MFLNVIDKLAEKIYYKFNPVEFKKVNYKYEAGNRLKRLIQDKYNVSKDFEYSQVMEIKDGKYQISTYVVKYNYTAGWFNNKLVLPQGVLEVEKDQLESLNYEVINEQRFNEGIAIVTK